MSEFIRARNIEQKQIRMDEIKAAADGLFAQKPYHEITLTTIAEQLSWSRANLYKYVTTKEEIFLELCGEKQNAYFAALQAAFDSAVPCSAQQAAARWAAVLDQHRAYLRYSSLLLTVIETNVSLERLVAFKRKYYAHAEALCETLAGALKLTPAQTGELLLRIHYQAIGLNSSCVRNPLVQQAMAVIGRESPSVDFHGAMEGFIQMCIEHYQQ